MKKAKKAKKAAKKITTSRKMTRTPNLLIVESPAKVKTISKFLGGDFHVMSTFGHIKDLPTKELGVEIIDGKIKLTYVPIKNKEKMIADICKQASVSDEIFLASDPDREGEIIAWHICQAIKKIIKDPSHIHRITFNEITKSAITEAINKKDKIDAKKVKAQQARRILDRWVGYEVSPILWQKISKGLSAGRVQSVALLLICSREKEIENFVPEESWSIHGTFEARKTQIEAELAKINNKTLKLKNKEEAQKALAEIKKEKFEIDQITETKRSKSAAPPFMTSTLQQDAYNKLGFSVDKTMSIAQKLYEGLPLFDKNTPQALITYMRTDSLRISDIALKASRSFIKSKFGEKYLPKTVNLYSKKGAQDAHEAIRPIDVNVTPEITSKYLDTDAAKLYSLIWKRFMACQMTKAEYLQKQLLIKSGKYLFKATGSTLVFDGFLKVYITDDEDDKKALKLPKNLKAKDQASLKKSNAKQHFTQPPPRYTEASLVKEMEKRGIGRPSTYAATIFIIRKREYIEKNEAKRFQPTNLGITVNDLLVKNLPDIINVTFTAKMEEDLDKIARGEVERDKVLLDFYEKFEKEVKAFRGKNAVKQLSATNLKCPKCGAPLVIRYGKTGQFVGCSKFPKCTFTSNFMKNGDGKIHLESTNEETKISSELQCPHCGKTLVQKTSRFGPFWACPGYPECKYIHQEKLNMKCPKCKKGKMIKRKWKGGSFWGCDKYPKCDFAIFGEVEESKCPKCKSPYLLKQQDKDGNITLSCPNKECDYKKKKS